jgi:hypothetical protein
MLRLLGPVVRLQVQRASLKCSNADGSFRWYDPGPLCAVPELEVTPDGVVGCPASGERLVDVHNRRHPQSKNAEVNAISVGFTSHYASLRSQFGPHLTDGIAGENILVDTDTMVGLADLAGGVVIETQTGARVELELLEVAEPCLPFTRYALRYERDQPSDPTVTESLRSLREGRRGYYATYRGLLARLQPGDSVFAVTQQIAPASSGG